MMKSRHARQADRPSEAMHLTGAQEACTGRVACRESLSEETAGKC